MKLRKEANMGRKTLLANTLVSVAVGAAAGVAAIALSNKSTRNKLGKTVSNMSKQAQGIVRDLDKKSKPIVDEAKKAGSKTLNDAKKHGKPVVKKATKTIKESLNN